MAPKNTAAFHPADKAPSVEVGPSPYPTVGANEVIIKVGAFAINPVDWKLQAMGRDVFPSLQYPYTGGFDVSGTIVEVGAGAETAFKKGDRVLAFCHGFDSRSGAFQEYVAAAASVTAHIPDSLSFVDATVLPTGLTTAAVALYQYLGLEFAASSEKGAKTVFVAGGASSVGSNAIQLAVASGYTVYTTSSPANFAHCLSLGASKVFDYRSPSVAQDLKDAFQDKECVGAFSSLPEANALVFDVIAAIRTENGNRKVASAHLVDNKGVPENISAKMIMAATINDDAPLLDALYRKFLPDALAAGRYQCVPKPVVAGHSLDDVQAALDRGKTGSLSCEKLVVALDGEA
ncbi:GroES-like protein [Poronia punctata]|nr:GroES-like protein [Poronia punctata]